MSNTSPESSREKFPANSRAMAAELAPVLRELESSRQKSLVRIRQGQKRIAMAIIITLAVSLLLFFVSSQSSHQVRGFPFPVFIPVVIGILFCFFTHNKYIKGHRPAYRDAYKRQVIGGMTKILYPDVIYAPARGISEPIFKQAGLYNADIDRYSCEDLFAGKVGQTEIMFSEIHAEDKRKRTNSKGKTQTYWVTIFKGIFFIADFNKNFRSWLTVKPDFAESSFGWFGRKIQGFSPNLIRLENPDFEKAFVVHGGDQVEARYILTPDMQERLLTLRNYYGADIRLSLQNSQINLTIPQSENWFEPNINLPTHEPSQMQTFIDQMRWIFGTIEALDLNTSIWSKQ